MMIRTPLIAAMAAAVLLTTAGCAVSRGQETVGAYMDDTSITTRVKSRLFENKDVAGSSISVETLNGTVMPRAPWRSRPPRPSPARSAV